MHVLDCMRSLATLYFIDFTHTTPHPCTHGDICLNVYWLRISSLLTIYIPLGLYHILFSSLSFSWLHKLKVFHELFLFAASCQFFFYFFTDLYNEHFNSVSRKVMYKQMKFYCITRTKPKLAIWEVKTEGNKGHVSIRRTRLTAAIPSCLVFIGVSMETARGFLRIQFDPGDVHK